MMNEKAQILYMQVRLVRLASNEWNMPISEVGRVFYDNGVFEYIDKLWDLFHVEGDYAVLEDIKSYLQNRKVTV